MSAPEDSPGAGVVELALANDAAPRVWLLHDDDAGALRERARALCGEQAQGVFCSRSYSAPHALVAVWAQAVGVDVEAIGPLEDVDAFAATVCTPAELAAGADRTAEGMTTLWSAKEALAKALGDAVSYDPRRLESPAGWPDGVSGAWRARALPVPAGFVGWVCWRA